MFGLFRIRNPQEKSLILLLKGELQSENKLISYERTFKMQENDMHITVIGQAVLELLSYKVGSGNHQTGVSLLRIFRRSSEI